MRRRGDGTVDPADSSAATAAAASPYAPPTVLAGAARLAVVGAALDLSAAKAAPLFLAFERHDPAIACALRRFDALIDDPTTSTTLTAGGMPTCGAVPHSDGEWLLRTVRECAQLHAPLPASEAKLQMAAASGGRGVVVDSGRSGAGGDAAMAASSLGVAASRQRQAKLEAALSPPPSCEDAALARFYDRAATPAPPPLDAHAREHGGGVAVWLGEVSAISGSCSTRPSR